MDENQECAANGGQTISRPSGCINDEMRECTVCHHQCRWDMVDQPFFGFTAACPMRAQQEETHGDSTA